MKIEGNTIEEAKANLEKLRRWQPFKYGGKIFLSMINGQAYAMRYEKALENKCRKAGLTRYTIYHFH